MLAAFLRSVLVRTLSDQLGNPRGLIGGMVAKRLNKNNRGPITEAVAALGPLPHANVADIGFGGGLGLELLLKASPDCQVHGVEPSASMIDRARREFRQDVSSGRLSLHLATMDRLPFSDGQLDAWITVNTVYFIEDLELSLTELARVLTPSGVGVIGAADPDWLATQQWAQQGFKVRPVADLVAQIESAGMTVERRTVSHEASEHPYNLLMCRH